MQNGLINLRRTADECQKLAFICEMYTSSKVGRNEEASTYLIWSLGTAALRVEEGGRRGSAEDGFSQSKAAHFNVRWDESLIAAKMLNDRRI